MANPGGAMLLREVHYRIAGHARGLRPGRHRSASGDGGFEFRAHAPLIDAPDARRIDLHASLRDPYGQWLVRLHSQRRAITVAVVADLSASMGFVDGAGLRRQDVLADLVASLAWSAWRSGDRFAFVGASDHVHAEFAQPPTRARGAGLALAERLRAFEPKAPSAQALREAAQHLPAQGALVFLVSDFHWPLDELPALLAGLAAHQVVPVVLWQAGEFALDGRRGLAAVREPEGGRRVNLWWRPALRARWQAARDQRRAELTALLRAAGLAPVWIEGAYDADALTRHFV